MALESMLYEVTYSQICGAETCPCLAFPSSSLPASLGFLFHWMALQKRVRSLSLSLFEWSVSLCLSGVMMTK